MSDVRVIGIGSPFDNDTIGWRVLEYLKQKTMLATSLPTQIDLLEADRPGMGLIQLLQDARFVILVDAILDDKRHGNIIRLDKTQLMRPPKVLSSHGMDVANAVALAEKIQGLPEKLVILGMGVDQDQTKTIDETSVQQLASAVTSELEAYFLR